MVRPLHVMSPRPFHPGHGPALTGRGFFSSTLIRALLALCLGVPLAGAQSRKGNADGAGKGTGAQDEAYTARLVRVIECPPEITKRSEDIRFGAMVTTHVFSPAAAATLGFPDQAGRSLLVTSAPLASVEKKNYGGCVAIIDPVTGACLRLLTAPAPMQVWKQGRMSERYDDMQFGRNFAFSPGGTRLFVGATFGGMGFVLDLTTGNWSVISHPHMMLCRLENGKAVINNSARLSYGCKGIFADETTLYVVSETLTYDAPSPGSLAPGALFYEVKLAADGSVASMADPHKPNPSPEDVAKEEGVYRGFKTNRAIYRYGGLPFGCFPAMDFHQGRLASTMHAVGDDRSRGVIAGETHHFYAYIPGKNMPVGSANHVTTVPARPGEEGMPYIDRRVPLPPGPRSKGDCIAVRSANNAACYAPDPERFRPFHDFPGPKASRIETMGVIDRTRAIGWLCSDSFAGVFRWDGAQPQYRAILAKAEGLFPRWHLDYNALEGTEVRGWKMGPWTTLHVDAREGLLYIGQTGAAINSANVKIHPGRIHVFDIAQPLRDLGLEPSPPPMK